MYGIDTSDGDPQWGLGHDTTSEEDPWAFRDMVCEGEIVYGSLG